MALTGSQFFPTCTVIEFWLASSCDFFFGQRFNFEFELYAISESINNYIFSQNYLSLTAASGAWYSVINIYIVHKSKSAVTVQKSKFTFYVNISARNLRVERTKNNKWMTLQFTVYWNISKHITFYWILFYVTADCLSIPNVIRLSIEPRKKGTFSIQLLTALIFDCMFLRHNPPV